MSRSPMSPSRHGFIASNNYADSARTQGQLHAPIVEGDFTDRGSVQESTTMFSSRNVGSAVHSSDPRPQDALSDGQSRPTVASQVSAQPGNGAHTVTNKTESNDGDQVHPSVDKQKNLIDIQAALASLEFLTEIADDYAEDPLLNNRFKAFDNLGSMTEKEAFHLYRKRPTSYTLSNEHAREIAELLAIDKQYPEKFPRMFYDAIKSVRHMGDAPNTTGDYKFKTFPTTHQLPHYESEELEGLARRAIARFFELYQFGWPLAERKNLRLWPKSDVKDVMDLSPKLALQKIVYWLGREKTISDDALSSDDALMRFLWAPDGYGKKKGQNRDANLERKRKKDAMAGEGAPEAGSGARPKKSKRSTPKTGHKGIAATRAYVQRPARDSGDSDSSYASVSDNDPPLTVPQHAGRFPNEQPTEPMGYNLNDPHGFETQTSDQHAKSSTKGTANRSLNHAFLRNFSINIQGPSTVHQNLFTHGDVRTQLGTTNVSSPSTNELTARLPHDRVMGTGYSLAQPSHTPPDGSYPTAQPEMTPHYAATDGPEKTWSRNETAAKTMDAHRSSFAMPEVRDMPDLEPIPYNEVGDLYPATMNGTEQMQSHSQTATQVMNMHHSSYATPEAEGISGAARDSYFERRHPYSDIVLKDTEWDTTRHVNNMFAPNDMFYDDY